MSNSSMIDSLAKDLRHLVSRAAVSRIVDIEHTVASASSQEHPVTTVVHVGDNTVTLRQATADLALIGRLNRLELGLSEIIRLRPDNVASTSITTVLRQVRVQRRRIHTGTLGLQHHRHRGHCATSGADRLAGACAKLLIGPARVTLLVANPSIHASGSSIVVNLRFRDELG